MKKDPINETFNQIITKIASGVNYASELAKEIGKSIPVTFRQLDELIGLGILKKERSGKRVEYRIEWKTIANSFLTLTKKEFSNAQKIISIKMPSLELKEFEKIFEIEYVQNSFKKMYQEIEKAGKIAYNYTKTKFNESLSMFLEAFGDITESQEKEILKEIPLEKHKNFKKFMEIGKMHKKIQDRVNPRKNIFLRK
jgi:hypothetical protein